MLGGCWVGGGWSWVSAGAGQNPNGGEGGWSLRAHCHARMISTAGGWLRFWGLRDQPKTHFSRGREEGAQDCRCIERGCFFGQKKTGCWDVATCAFGLYAGGLLSAVPTHDCCVCTP